VHSTPYSGRVYLFFSKSRREPRLGPDWFNPENFVALDVQQWKPGETLVVSPTTDGLLGFPDDFGNMELGDYRAQAVVRFNPVPSKIGTGPGNGYSQVVLLDSGVEERRVELVVDQLVADRDFRETKWTRLLRVRSSLLSDFYGRDVYLNAAVNLPASYYDSPQRAYPTIFSIPGFGGTHFGASRSSPAQETNERGVEFLRVTLDPRCPRGHHVFADSANNGPVGRALISELISEFDRQYRSVALPSGRFLRGHSSGGWSSLWLQVTYPDFFGGTWSTAPDPVDFRDFQLINLYRPREHMYLDGTDHERPLARRRDRVVLTYRGFAEMERVLGYGGQLHSFEAAFSPRGSDGLPLPVWDRTSGRVNTDVALSWKRFDIRLILEENWPALGPRLVDKIHVFAGGKDTFYLDGAARLLQQSLRQLSDNPVVEIHPGKSHVSLLTKQLRQRIDQEMVTAFLKYHAADVSVSDLQTPKKCVARRHGILKRICARLKRRN
jgi:hypothetical protein